MRTGEPKRISLILILLIVAMLIMLFAPVYADDGHGHHHDDDGDVTIDNMLTGGDNTASNSASISGGRSYGLGLGDVDINDCLYSWSFIVQGVGLNKWCASERMDAMGLHDSAAQMRCNIRQVKKLYKNREQCIQSQTITEVLQVEPAKESVDTDEDDDRYEAVYARLMDLEAQRTTDADSAQKAVARVQRAADEASARAQRAESQPAQIVDSSADRRARARQARQKALEGNE